MLLGPHPIPMLPSLGPLVVPQLDLPLAKRFHIAHDCSRNYYFLGPFAIGYVFLGELYFEKFFCVCDLTVGLERWISVNIFYEKIFNIRTWFSKCLDRTNDRLLSCLSSVDFILRQ